MEQFYVKLWIAGCAGLLFGSFVLLMNLLLPIMDKQLASMLSLLFTMIVFWAVTFKFELYDIQNKLDKLNEKIKK